MEVNPLSIILVKSDSKGDRLLFRYPINIQEKNESQNTKRKNPYALPAQDDLLQSPLPLNSNINKGHLTGLGDEVLSSLFAVKPDLCDIKFELKVNDVRFVGHPTLLTSRSRNNSQDDTGLLQINIVFALQALASHSVVKCYYDLSKRLGVALRYEEKRCGYVSEQTQLMTGIHDDVHSSSHEGAFHKVLQSCALAQNLKNVYDDLCSTGLVNIRINRWIPISFCLPQKVHQWHLRGKIIEPEDIDMCLGALRPYHGMLLLYTPAQMHDFMLLDGSPTLTRLLSMYTPLKSLQTLAADADLTLAHVFQLTAHLVYWAKATVIYPLCASNKYVISPDAPLTINSPLVDKFSEQYPGMNLVRVISEFSLPTSLGQKCNPLCNPGQQSQLVQMMIWMLQHHLLLQLHTYVMYMPSDEPTSMSTSASEAQGGAKAPTPTTTAPSTAVTSPKAGNKFPAAIVTSGSSTINSGAESESGTSTVSETPEPTSQSTDVDLIQQSIENVSFTSVEEEKTEYQEELLLDFPESERQAIFQIPAANSPEDLALFGRLCRKGYFRGEHHIEEIMYLENLRRSHLLQLLDKFRDVLITYETEDPAIAMFSCSTINS